MKSKRIAALCLALALLSGAAGCDTPKPSLDSTRKGATDMTRQANEEVYHQLDFNNKDEMNAAASGLLDSPADLEIKDKDGKVLWSQKAFSFITEETPSPDTVNPGLWSYAQMNRYYGLFQVSDRIFQVRGYDVTNLTLVAGDTGWIVIDPMSSEEALTAAMELVKKNLENRPVSAVVYTAASANHFGGVLSLLGYNYVPIIAPDGYPNAAGTEKLLTGNLTRRSARFLNGSLLPADVQGNLLVGGGDQAAEGTVSYRAPTDLIKETGETREIDGVTMEFQLARDVCGATAMNIYFPQTKCLWLSENCSGVYHDLYGAAGEDAAAPQEWAGFLTETVSRYGDKAEIVIEAHNWPHQGNEPIGSYLLNQAGAYQFIHDQTLRMMNQGYREEEIAKLLTLPDNLNSCWYLRQFCASLPQAIRMVYEDYSNSPSLNPVYLNPLSDHETASRLIQYMGDGDEILKKAQEDYQKGDYQWVAQITNLLVEADPGNEQARFLCADALEQLGYQSESVLWRNAYLTGAKELREGVSPSELSTSPFGNKAQSYVDGVTLLRYMGTLVDRDAAAGVDLTFLLKLTDEDKTYTVKLQNSVLLAIPGTADASCENRITCTTAGLVALINKNEQKQKFFLSVQGDQSVPSTLSSCLNRPSQDFNIVTP